MEFISNKWPIVHEKSLYVNNPYNNIGIVTFWSDIEYVKTIILDYSNINTIGNAYSKILCLNPILVNLSSNRYIRYLLLCGDDKEKAEETITSFFEGNLIDSMDDEYKHSLEIVKKQIKIIKCNFENINKIISSLPQLSPYNDSIINIEEILKPKSSIIWNSNTGYVLRSNNLTELFFKVNQIIITRGKLSKIRDNNIREINNLMTVYDGPILDKLDDVFLIDNERIQAYYNEFRYKILPKDQPYIYSKRIFMDNIINELKKDKFTKRGYSPIFYPDDYNLQNNPCAVGVHYLLIDNKLNSTIFFRSNDMFRAWPLNMLGFRFQQQLIANELKYEIGPTTIISSSAHIYSENWKNAIDIVNETIYIKNKFYDPEGYFICSKEEDDTLLVNYYSVDGKIQWMWQRKNEEYEELINEITSYITDTQHAGYLGKELTKLAHNIYTKNSVNKMLNDIGTCEI